MPDNDRSTDTIPFRRRRSIPMYQRTTTQSLDPSVLYRVRFVFIEDEKVVKKQDMPNQGDAKTQEPAAQTPSDTALEIPLSNYMIIGRTDGNDDMPVDVDFGAYQGREKGVSRYHAILQIEDKSIYIKDFNSSNGTFLNGFSLQPMRGYHLRNGDEISFGQLRAIIEFISVFDRTPVTGPLNIHTSSLQDTAETAHDDEVAPQTITSASQADTLIAVERDAVNDQTAPEIKSQTDNKSERNLAHEMDDNHHNMLDKSSSSDDDKDDKIFS